jgi:hypothetical protein
MSSNSLEELHCRLRNRIIEHLELVSSCSKQLAYQAAVPIAQVSGELFNGWGDWVADEAAIAQFGPPVFTPAEVSAIRQFNQQLETVAAATPDMLPPIDQFVATPEWQALSNAAKQALLVFAARGLSPEQ